MAHPVQLIDPATGRTAMAFHGFSWTCFFFGPFPALFRGHVLGFLIMLVCAIPTFGLSGLVFSFIYNGMHRSWLMGKGFQAPGAAFGFASQNVINVSVGNVAGVSAAPAADAAPIVLDQIPVLPAQAAGVALPRH